MSLKKVKEAAEMLKSRFSFNPKAGLILGSGLGDLAEELDDAVVFPYEDIPHFPISTVAGHKGQLVAGLLEGVPVLAMQGRFHFYEGYSMQDVTFPVRVMHEAGCESLIVTNACGAMNTEFSPGDLMIITDHINFTGANPLIGKNTEEFGPRFPDMSRAYDEGLVVHALDTASSLSIDVQQGIYAAVSGPSYMAGAELKMLQTCGADTVGMSTVPETIAAKHMGMNVLGISCITDMAVPGETDGITHEEVMKTAAAAKPVFKKLVRGILGQSSKETWEKERTNL
ncbi:purine-nucleoside phosphorylase [Alkalicoccus halolimnae]|uniref:Purine nucleoside phosphorylase n=1 Tax=Alkalicoccus halolimnae TaxID=1667239 RepID=A0A5C7FDQ5_9BACI|nr:purine-nucleoside phosphorylase [Alkalicoccus halolimnae]TXF83057.1 purine-nucleoside phosphorylase [Alkalicoccus halolimnae]